MNTHPSDRMRQLETLVAAHQDELFRFALFRTGSQCEAEDIVQEAFLRYATAERPVDRPRAYLFRAVANACCDLHRRARLRQEALDPTLPAPDEPWAEEAARCAALLDRLPDDQAETIRLHTYAGLRFTEIAEVLDCPVTTVKSRFRYGIDKLRISLNAQKPKS